MAYRCPNAKIVGTMTLKDWKLVFRKHANIEPCKGSEVPVLIWEITEADEKRLDKYEGVPKSCAKKYLPEGMVYVMAKKREIEAPTPEYLKKIESGYEKFGFNKETLNKAVMLMKLKSCLHKFIKSKQHNTWLYRILCN